MTPARRAALEFLDAAADGKLLRCKEIPAWDDADMKLYRHRVKKNLNTPHMKRLPTPTQRDWRSGKSNLIGTNARPLNEVVVNQFPGSGWICPTFVEWMMGFPKDWTQL
jgi:hypothetical protein